MVALAFLDSVTCVVKQLSGIQQNSNKKVHSCLSTATLSFDLGLSGWATYDGWDSLVLSGITIYECERKLHRAATPPGLLSGLTAKRTASHATAMNDQLPLTVKKTVQGVKIWQHHTFIVLEIVQSATIMSWTNYSWWNSQIPAANRANSRCAHFALREAGDKTSYR